MSGYVWDLSGTDKQCASYGPGHQIHWIHFNHSMREPSVVIPVTAVVDDDGLVRMEGDDLCLVCWNHRPALLHAALQRFGGMADWKPRWHLLAVPTEAFMGSVRRWAKGASATFCGLPTPTTWFPTSRPRRMCRPCGSLPGMPLGDPGLRGAVDLGEALDLWSAYALSTAATILGTVLLMGRSSRLVRTVTGCVGELDVSMAHEPVAGARGERRPDTSSL
jgi:hypothetical protein